ncbi:hypothetical protein, partial [Klebsiella pneumoniae]|uniref:hypothetical protein n=1 Tax=Klebsiella pneumoniae TaxID=573 RepID=UPI0025A02409
GDTYSSVALSVADGVITSTPTTISTIPSATPSAHIAAGKIRRVQEGVNEDCTFNVTIEEQFSELIDPAIR